MHKVLPFDFLAFSYYIIYYLYGHYIECLLFKVLHNTAPVITAL